MAKFLITGGLGFIGSHLIDRLRDQGHRLRVMDNRSSAVLADVPDSVELHPNDIRDTESLKSALDGVDGCFHLAAIASVVRCNEEWWQSHMVNLNASVALFELAGRAGIPVVYASSAAIYGNNPNPAIDEDQPANPLSPYGADKAAMEVHARMGASIQNLSTVGLRFFNVYGPRQSPQNPYAGVITKFQNRIAQDEPIRVDGDGSQTRDFVYVGDVARAIDLAMRRLQANANGTIADVYNVCTGRPISIKRLAGRMIELAGSGIEIVHGPTRAGDIGSSTGDPRKAAEILHFEAQIHLKSGLQRLTTSEAQPA